MLLVTHDSVQRKLYLGSHLEVPELATAVSQLFTYIPFMLASHKPSGTDYVQRTNAISRKKETTSSSLTTSAYDSRRTTLLGKDSN